MRVQANTSALAQYLARGPGHLRRRPSSDETLARRGAERRDRRGGPRRHHRRGHRHGRPAHRRAAVLSVPRRPARGGPAAKAPPARCAPRLREAPRLRLRGARERHDDLQAPREPGGRGWQAAAAPGAGEELRRRRAHDPGGPGNRRASREGGPVLRRSDGTAARPAHRRMGCPTHAPVRAPVRDLAASRPPAGGPPRRPGRRRPEALRDPRRPPCPNSACPCLRKGAFMFAVQHICIPSEEKSSNEP